MSEQCPFSQPDSEIVTAAIAALLLEIPETEPPTAAEAATEAEFILNTRVCPRIGCGLRAETAGRLVLLSTASAAEISETFTLLDIELPSDCTLRSLLPRDEPQA